MERKTITVTALNKYLKYRFENDDNLKDILLKAEISNFRRHSRGHLYFSLKDEASQVRAVMFLQNAKSLKFEPKDGAKVIIEGYVSVYEATGEYQVYVNQMTEEGIGDLYQAFEKLKIKLAEQGYFDPAHKQALPTFPKVIGVITSPTGAAVRDVINIINRRYPLVKIIVYPALVQGEEAKFSLVKAIEKANSDLLADVLIVGRGGGSIEDLWAFNEEMVAKAIYQSRIPIVSAVGHETDTTIADYVADLRAPTPSGAAEMVVPDQRNLYLGISETKTKMDQLLQRILQVEKRHLNQIMQSYVFTNSSRIIEKPTMQVMHLSERLMQTRPDKLLKQANEKVELLETRMHGIYTEFINSTIQNFISTTEKLEILNPLNLMKKGYAIVRKDGKIHRTIETIKRKDTINVSLSDGTIIATVDDLIKEVL